MTSVILLVVGLLVGGGGSYIFMSNTSSQVGVLTADQGVLESENLALEAQSATLENDVSALESDLVNAENQISDYEAEISSLENDVSVFESQLVNAENLILVFEAEISTLETDVSSLGSQVTSLNTQKSSLQSQVSTLQSSLTQKNNLIDDLRDDIDELEADISSISDIIVTQHYAWDFGSGYYATEYTWDLSIPLGTYLNYYFADRPIDWDDWVGMVNDPDDDYSINGMVQGINNAAIRDGMSEIEKVNFVIDFVQSLPYTEDSVTTDWDEYPRYPLETLFDRGGDCEDTSILVAALLDRLGYDVCLIFPVDKNHCAVGIAIQGAYGSYYDYDGTKYYYLETTGEGWEIGDIPADYQGVSANIYPINE